MRDGPADRHSGIRVHKLLLDSWAAAKTVEVDFDKVLPTPTFPAEAIGRLIVPFTNVEKLKVTGRYRLT